MRGLVAAINHGLEDALKDPDAAVAAVAKREPLIKVAVERERLDATLKDEMNHPEIAKIGARQCRPGAAEALDRHPGRGRQPAAHADGRRNLHAGVPAADQRTAEEAVLSPLDRGCSAGGGGAAASRQTSRAQGRDMEFNLNGRVAMITGPGQGHGRGDHARRLPPRARGWRWSAATSPPSSRSPRRSRRPAREAIIVPCDLTDPQQCDDAAAKTKAAYGGRIDILVNVAGGSGPIGKTGVETTPEEFDDIVTLNMNGCVPHHARRAAGHDRAALRQDRQCRRHLRHARARRAHGLFRLEMGPARHHQKLRARSRRNTTSTSIASRRAWSTARASATKSAPRWRKRLGISVEEAVERHAAEYALKRVTVDSDVANACLFLASDVSRQITGVDLPVDGGWAML